MRSFFSWFLGVIFGFMLHIAFMAYSDYLYVQRDNECMRRGEDIMSCNRYKNTATWFEKFSNFRLDTACIYANEDLRFIYCKEQ